MVKITPNKEKINTNQIEVFSKQIGYSFPRDFIKFLLKNNGGKLELNLCDAEQFGQFTIDVFFGIGLKNELNDLRRIITVFKDRIPSHYLPIASTEGGNLICLSLLGNIGEIYFWDHEEESEEGEEATSKNMYKIASNFTSFLELIKKFDSSKIELKEEDIISTWIDPDFLKEIQD